MYCDELAQVTWRIRLEEFIFGKNYFVFNVPLYLDPGQRSDIVIGGLGSWNNSANNSIPLKAI